jgi:hypothetical protein
MGGVLFSTCGRGLFQRSADGGKGLLNALKPLMEIGDKQLLVTEGNGPGGADADTEAAPCIAAFGVADL